MKKLNFEQMEIINGGVNCARTHGRGMFAVAGLGAAMILGGPVGIAFAVGSMAFAAYDHMRCASEFVPLIHQDPQLSVVMM